LNTAYRAARAYMEHFGSPGAMIRIEKHIPSEAGLGGASADAAAVLLGMEALYKRAKGDLSRLFPLSEKIGADVPFCLLGGCALCEGIGERMHPLPPLPLSLLLVKPKAGISTAALFRGLRFPVAHPDTEAAIAAIEAGDLAALGANLKNSLEESALALLPEIGELKARLLSSGALGAVTSGSGSTVFGLFPDMERAKRAEEGFSDVFFSAALATI